MLSMQNEKRVHSRLRLAEEIRAGFEGEAGIATIEAMAWVQMATLDINKTFDKWS